MLEVTVLGLTFLHSLSFKHKTEQPVNFMVLYPMGVLLVNIQQVVNFQFFFIEGKQSHFLNLELKQKSKKRHDMLL